MHNNHLPSFFSLYFAVKIESIRIWYKVACIWKRSGSFMRTASIFQSLLSCILCLPWFPFLTMLAEIHRSTHVHSFMNKCSTLHTGFTKWFFAQLWNISAGISVKILLRITPAIFAHFPDHLPKRIIKCMKSRFILFCQLISGINACIPQNVLQYPIPKAGNPLFCSQKRFCRNTFIWRIQITKFTYLLYISIHAPMKRATAKMHNRISSYKMHF